MLKRISFLLFLILTATSCTRMILLGEKDCGHGFYAGVNGDCQTWDQGSVLEYYIDPSVQQAELDSGIPYIQEINAAFNVWSENLKLLRVVYGGVRGGEGEGSDGVNTIYFVTQSWNRGELSQAFTRVYGQDKNLKEADIFINGTMNFSSERDFSAVHFRSLLIHEAGHFLGLVHNHKDPESVMWETLARGQVRDQLAQMDIDILSFGYDLILFSDPII